MAGLTPAQTSPHWQTILQGAALVVAVWALRQLQEGRDLALLLVRLVGARALVALTPTAELDTFQQSFPETNVIRTE